MICAFLSLWSSAAHGWNFKAGAGIVDANPVSFNQFVSLDSSSTDISSVENPPTLEMLRSLNFELSNSSALLGLIGLEWGVVGNIFLVDQMNHAGVTRFSSGIFKATQTSLWTAGPLTRFKIMRAGGLELAVEGALALGRLTLSQLTDQKGSVSALQTHAIAVQTMVRASTQIDLYKNWLKLQGYLGYQMIRSTYFTVKAASGESYTDIATGDRLKLNYGGNSADLRMVFEGLGYGANLVLSL